MCTAWRRQPRLTVAVAGKAARMSAQLLWVGGSGVNRCQCENATIVKHKHIRTQGEREELDQANIALGLRWLGRMWWKDTLSDHFGIELHRKLFGDVWRQAGRFRQTGKKIGVEPIQLRILMDDAR